MNILYKVLNIDVTRFAQIFILLVLIMGFTACFSISQEVVNKKSTEIKTKSDKGANASEKQKAHLKINQIFQSAEAKKNLGPIPKIQREMRGVYIATVNNIDWPSKPGLSVKKQKEELEAILDQAKKVHLNTVFLQVRPAADALYQSPYEPWSYYLTGKQGKPPTPYYDPLKFTIKQAHRRGLELQAWFNPFRAYDSTEPAKFPDKSIVKTHPEWVVKYGNNYWLNPGIKEARNYTLKVILDVVRRYDIDGVLLDDYFYPYTEWTSSHNAVPFPDNTPYRLYVKKFGAISRGDWRRQNINRFVRQLHDSLRKIKPKIPFGISPFGIWRPGHPSQVVGYDAYARIFADSRKWFRKGWVDFLSPQLYWAIDNPGQKFPVLLKWWKKQNVRGRHLWPSLFTGKAGSSWDAEQIVRQIKIIRSQTKSAGEIHFSMNALQNNDGQIDNHLIETVYKEPALIPRSPWLGKKRPFKPHAIIKRHEKHYSIYFNNPKEKQPFLWLVKVKYGDHWDIKVIPGWEGLFTLPLNSKYGKLQGVVVYSVNRLGNLSEPDVLVPGQSVAETVR